MIPDENGHYRLVMVHWVDSSQPTTHWQWLSDFETKDCVRVETAGWLLSDGDVVAVAQSIGGDGDLADQAMGVVHIPRRAVIEIVELSQEAA